MRTKHLKREDRIVQIVDAAFKLAREKGLHNITLPKIAARIDISHSLISRYFNTIEELRYRVARMAIEMKDYVLIGNLITSNHPVAKEIPDDLRRDVVVSLYESSSTTVAKGPRK